MYLDFLFFNHLVISFLTNWNELFLHWTGTQNIFAGTQRMGPNLCLLWVHKLVRV